MKKLMTIGSCFAASFLVLGCWEIDIPTADVVPVDATQGDVPQADTGGDTVAPGPCSEPLNPKCEPKPCDDGNGASQDDKCQMIKTPSGTAACGCAGVVYTKTPCDIKIGDFTQTSGYDKDPTGTIYFYNTQWGQIAMKAWNTTPPGLPPANLFWIQFGSQFFFSGYVEFDLSQLDCEANRVGVEIVDHAGTGATVLRAFDADGGEVGKAANTTSMAPETLGIDGSGIQKAFLFGLECTCDSFFDVFVEV